MAMRDTLWNVYVSLPKAKRRYAKGRVSEGALGIIGFTDEATALNRAVMHNEHNPEDVARLRIRFQRAWEQGELPIF